MNSMKQRTIESKVEARGIGLHSGRIVTMRLLPAEADSGIVFERTDVDGPDNRIKVSPECVVDTMLCTKMGNQSGITIGTVEHLMSALYGLGIDNILVQIDAEELPVFDGSAAPFMLLIESAGMRVLDTPKKIIKVMRPVEVTDGDKRASFKPDDQFSVTLEIDFDHPLIAKQRQRFDVTGDTYRRGIARARTFCFQDDVEKMQSMGLALGGGLDNAVVVSDFSILNPGGLRYDDEFIRHKVLDAIGDLYMIGHPIVGAFEATMTGHGLNNALLKALMADKNNYRYVEAPEDSDILPLASTEDSAA